MSDAPPPFDSARYRQVLGHFPTGVTVITAAAEGVPAGMAVGSFSSVSLEPPLVLFSVARQSRSLAAFQVARHVAVNVLSSDQLVLCQRFARSSLDKWEGIDFEL